MLPNDMCCMIIMICAFTCCNKDISTLLTGTCCLLACQSCRSTPSVLTFRQFNPDISGVVYGASHCFTGEMLVSTCPLPSMRSTGMTCSCSGTHKLPRTALLPVSAETYLFGTCSNYAKESTGEMHELS